MIPNKVTPSTEMAPLPKKSVTIAPMDSDEEKNLLEEQFKRANLAKYRLKGSRNRSNPVNMIKRAHELIIVKEGNYTDCMTCHFCIKDNNYKVYTVDDYLYRNMETE